ncbi:lysophospholipid acyltransferase family protein [Paraconexibacter sp.]|uniref:lysophospholipid acyltransferase family protein n=1 Tax=Paraconexibacter sp. TaxID=2949640 RepID=UPI003561D272
MAPITRTYRFAMAACSPAVRSWGRLEVVGQDLLPSEGPLLIAGNHDSYWDPVAIGIAGMPRRQICALAKRSLWKPGLGLILDGMGQIPIERGKGDLAAMATAIERLRDGACIGVFPEGTRSLGRELRARSGIGRLAAEVPEAEIVCARVMGTVDIPRFPRSRPRVSVEFFRPAGGGLRSDESPAEFAARLVAEIREAAPRVRAGRRPRPAQDD